MESFMAGSTTPSSAPDCSRMTSSRHPDVSNVTPHTRADWVDAWTGTYREVAARRRRWFRGRAASWPGWGSSASNREERFDAKLIVVSPSGSGGVHIREVVDEDFGRFEKHGANGSSPTTSACRPTVTASSLDASATVDVTDLGGETRIRLGDADTTFNGPHRYILDYVLPEAHSTAVSSRWTSSATRRTLRTTRFRGGRHRLPAGNDPTCKVGSFGDKSDCTLVRRWCDLRVVFEPLEPGQGITIGGTITGTQAPTSVPTPPLPSRRASHRIQLALAMLPLGALGGAAS